MSHGIMQEKVLETTAFGDPSISNDEKQKRGDALCELTAKFHGNSSGYILPEPDYDDAVYGTNTAALHSSDTEEKSKNPMSPEQLQKVKSKEFQSLNRDLKFRQKSGNYPKRPEFKTKYHEIMTKSAHKQEQQEESELITKLRTRSEIMNQDEKAKKQEEEKPEFMKVQLRKQHAQTS